MIRERILKIAIKLGKTNPKAANYLLKIAMPLVFDAEDPKETRPYEIVYRIENAAGEGPWRSRWKSSNDFSSFESFEILKQSARTKYKPVPNPLVDPGFLSHERQPSFFGKRLFAFDSPNQIDLYIMPQQWKLLNQNGFFLTSVKAKKIWSSGSQVFFEPYK